MVVQERGRGGAVVATAVAGGIAAGLLTTAGCSAGVAAGDHGKAAAVRAADGLGPGEALAAVRHAADVLAEAGGARVRTYLETVSGGTRLTILGTGGYGFGQSLGRLRVRVPAPGDAVPGAAGAPAGTPRPAITELFAPGALYMKNRGAGVPDAKWVRVATGSLGDGNLVANGATDPLAAAELLRGARRVEYAGSERSGGATVRHFTGDCDLARAARAASAGQRAALAAAAKGFFGRTVACDAYLDEQGRLRKVRHRFTLRDAGRGAMDVASTVELYAFGAKVTVRLPPATDIYTGKVVSPVR
ncbi:hypothetical protein [Streptomyces varsoviensis]|uniref:Lipoprotein n=1 Tax=Streptomyces varsoviensis TaxID=67373 RepID=A0ABR5JEJ6_9ACTN|nr:hypothetical protein [Streptomyces varsoviensis]KOG91846.1 hypothetical protein ADK38_00910 [Streptomyces varsoviensis]